MFNIHNERGFTLIEMLVIISVTIILSAILIGYSREAGRQLLLVNNQAKLVSLIARAKSLSTSTFLQDPLPAGPSDPKTCGYGAHLAGVSGEIFIFRDMAVDCSLSDNKYTSSDTRLAGELNVFKLDAKVVQFASDNTFNDIIFIPPDPTIVINSDVSVQEAVISIETKDGFGKVVVKVNNAGRISTK